MDCIPLRPERANPWMAWPPARRRRPGGCNALVLARTQGARSTPSLPWRRRCACATCVRWRSWLPCWPRPARPAPHGPAKSRRARPRLRPHPRPCRRRPRSCLPPRWRRPTRWWPPSRPTRPPPRSRPAPRSTHRTRGPWPTSCVPAASSTWRWPWPPRGRGAGWTGCRSTSSRAGGSRTTPRCARRCTTSCPCNRPSAGRSGSRGWTRSTWSTPGCCRSSTPSDAAWRSATCYGTKRRSWTCSGPSARPRRWAGAAAWPSRC